MKDPKKLDVDKDCYIVHSFPSHVTFSNEMTSQILMNNQNSFSYWKKNLDRNFPQNQDILSS